MRSFTWRLFGMFVAAPALLLAWLGLRAVRAERLEGEQQLRDQQSRVAQLADAAIANTLAMLARELQYNGDNGVASEPRSYSSIGTRVAFDSSGLVTFRQDKVYFGQFTQHASERVTLATWPAGVSIVIEQAQAAEAQGRVEEALVLLSRVRRAEPRLRAWADVVAARINLRHGRRAALSALVNETWSRSVATTPSGLPVAFVASSMSSERTPGGRRAFIPLIRGSLLALREGRWWLSAEERRFYDGELTRLLKEAGGTAAETHAPNADRLAQLTDIEQVIRQSPPSRRDAPSYAIERGARSAFLMVWSSYDAAAHEWRGLAITQERQSLLIGSALERLVSGLPFQAVVRDTAGGLVAGPALAGGVWRSESLSAIRGWEIAFSGPSRNGQIARRQWLWYGFIGLLLVVLFGGIGMTAQNVREKTELARMQSEFVGAVTHEFKSPITSIRLLLERVGAGRLTTPDAAAVYAAAIGREADRLERLVNRLLQAQQVEAGQRRHDFAEASLEEVTADVIRQIQPQADSRSIRIDLEADGRVPPVVIDRAIIADAVENLVDNAIKYSPPDTRIRVRIHADGTRACVDVEDEGIGIDADDIPRVFDRFYRARRGNQQDVRGTGLGLALVKAAADAHGGSVNVVSKPGKGSRFSIQLPLSAQPANAS